MTEYVCTADELFFHQQHIERYGGSAGIRDVGALVSALHRPQTGYYDALMHEAASLLESLIQDHPFRDGNERAAFAVVDVFLRINGHTITADSQTIHSHLMELMEQGSFDMEPLVPWFQSMVHRTDSAIQS